MGPPAYRDSGECFGTMIRRWRPGALRTPRSPLPGLLLCLSMFPGFGTSCVHPGVNTGLPPGGKRPIWQRCQAKDVSARVAKEQVPGPVSDASGGRALVGKAKDCRSSRAGGRREETIVRGWKTKAIQGVTSNGASLNHAHSAAYTDVVTGLGVRYYGKPMASFGCARSFGECLRRD